MRLASLDHFSLDPRKMVALGLVSGAACATAVALATGGALGSARLPAMLVVGALVFYIVLSAPRRLLDRQRVVQARESLLLSASATACLGVTGSRSKTVLLLRSRDPVMGEVVGEAGRRILLGERVESAVAYSSRRLGSYSAAGTLLAVASMSRRAFDGRDEEAKGMAASSELGRETKLPMFMTLCFFAPILLVLYAVFGHAFAPVTLAELATFEIVALDLALYLVSSEGRQR